MSDVHSSLASTFSCFWVSVNGWLSYFSTERFFTVFPHSALIICITDKPCIWYFDQHKKCTLTAVEEILKIDRKNLMSTYQQSPFQIVKSSMVQSPLWSHSKHYISPYIITLALCYVCFFWQFNNFNIPYLFQVPPTLTNVINVKLV